MPNLSNYKHQRIESLHKETLPQAAIFKQLKREELEVSSRNTTRSMTKDASSGTDRDDCNRHKRGTKVAPYETRKLKWHERYTVTSPPWKKYHFPKLFL